MPRAKLLNKGIDQGGFSHARFAGNQQVGFGLATQNLENGRDLIFKSHYRGQFTSSCLFNFVDTIFIDQTLTSARTNRVTLSPASGSTGTSSGRCSDFFLNFECCKRQRLELFEGKPHSGRHQ